MPRGPQGQRRPADVIGCAIMVAKITTGKMNRTVPCPDECAVVRQVLRRE
jgi:hypothetical protein